LRTRHAIVFQTGNYPAPVSALHAAETLIEHLGSAAPSKSLVGIVRATIDPADLAPSAPFWGTWLGRLLFLAGGYVHEAAPQATAALVLDLSRQRVHQLVTSGALRSEAGINPAARMVHAGDVREMLRGKIDRVVNPL